MEIEGADMEQRPVILEIDNPHLTVRLFESLLRIDLKGNVRNEIVEALENKPVLKETLGNILHLFAPLHIHLSDIASANVNDSGLVKLVLPHHRDITIPLELSAGKKLVEKLNELIPIEKEKVLERAAEKRKIGKEEHEEHEIERGSVGSGPFPIVQPPGVLDGLKEAEDRERE